MILSWLTGRAALYVAGGLLAAVAALAVALYLQGAALDRCRAKRAEQQVTIDAQARSIEGHRKVIAEQTASIAGLQAEGDRRQAEAAAALAKARASADKERGRRATLEAALRSPVPAGAGCDQAVATVRKGLKR